MDRKGWIAAAVGVVGMCVNCQNCEAVGKLFADLWKRLVFFHQVVNGFSIGTSGSFPYFHDAKISLQSAGTPSAAHTIQIGRAHV